MASLTWYSLLLTTGIRHKCHKRTNWPLIHNLQVGLIFSGILPFYKIIVIFYDFFMVDKKRFCCYRKLKIGKRCIRWFWIEQAHLYGSTEAPRYSQAEGSSTKWRQSRSQSIIENWIESRTHQGTQRSKSWGIEEVLK